MSTRYDISVTIGNTSSRWAKASLVFYLDDDNPGFSTIAFLADSVTYTDHDGGPVGATWQLTAKIDNIAIFDPTTWTWGQDPMAGTFGAWAYVDKSPQNRTVVLSLKATSSLGDVVESTVNVAIPRLTPYTVSYNANGGTGAPASQTAYGGVAFTLTSSKPSRSGFLFSKWNEKSDGTGTDLSPGGTYYINEATALYAQWNKGVSGLTIDDVTAIRVDSSSSTTEADEGEYALLTVAYTVKGAAESDVSMAVTAVDGDGVSHAVTVVSGTATKQESASEASQSGTFTARASNCDIEKTYAFTVVLTATNETATQTALVTIKSAVLPKAFFTMDYLAGGHGAALGKPATEAGLFDVGFDLNVDGDLMNAGEQFYPTFITNAHASFTPPVSPCLVLDTGDNGLYRYASSTYTLVHTGSGRSGTAGTSSATSGRALSVPYLTTDAQGHVTAKGTHTHTVPGSWYGTCGTAAATAAKVVTCSNFVLLAGALIAVRFSYANTAASPTLNVNSTGAKAIYGNGSTTAANTSWVAGETVLFVYDGSYWRMVNTVAVNSLRESVNQTVTLYSGTKFTSGSGATLNGSVNGYRLLRLLVSDSSNSSSNRSYLTICPGLTYAVIDFDGFTSVRFGSSGTRLDFLEASKTGVYVHGVVGLR